MKNTRDSALDIAKGILIILMMYGHMNISDVTHSIIYSFHMAAFVFYSGYCFKPTFIKNLTKTLLFPYVIGASAFVFMGEGTFVSKVLDILCGFSKTNKIFPDRSTVGQVYFLLLLFLVKFIYMYIYRYIKNDMLFTCVIVMLSFFGAFLGKYGYWLPWSLDSALFAIIFYHAGVLTKKYDIIGFVLRNNKYNIPLMVIWIVSITRGGMSLFVREYGNYFITVMGAICGSIFLYEVSFVLESHFKSGCLKWLVDIGKNTLSILLVHTIFGGYIVIIILNSLMKTELIDSLNIIYLIVLVVQIIFGLIWGRVYEKIIKALL